MKWPGFFAVAILMALAAGCVRNKAAPQGPRFAAFLAASAEMGEDPALFGAARDSIETMSSHIRERRQRGDEPYEALFTVLFHVFHYERELRRDDPRFFTFSAVLKGRRGTSLGLGEVALALAERLGLPLEGVAVPGHFYVRVPGAPGRNFELLRRAESLSDDWYRATYGPWPASGSGYGRALTAGEIIGLGWFHAGEFHRRQGELSKARRAFEKAVQSFPDHPGARTRWREMLRTTGAE